MIYGTLSKIIGTLATFLIETKPLKDTGHLLFRRVWPYRFIMLIKREDLKVILQICILI